MISVIGIILWITVMSCNATIFDIHDLALHKDFESEEWFMWHDGEMFFELDDGIFGKYGENVTIEEVLIDHQFHEWENILGCDFSQPSPIYDENTWEIFRSTYYEVSKSEPVPSSIVNGKRTGFQVPIEVQYIEGKGRGIIASEFIRKGDLIYSGKINPGEFWDLETFWKYVNALPSELSCDPIQWAYTGDLGEFDGSSQTKPVICFEMDEGALFNNDDVNNAGCHPMFDGEYHPEDCLKNFYAVENIYPGEEIQISYSDFVSELPFEEIMPMISVPVNHLHIEYEYYSQIF